VAGFSRKAPSTSATTSKQHRRSDNVDAALSNAISRKILSTKSNVASTLLPFLPTMSSERVFREISSFRQSRNKGIEHVQFVSTLSKRRNSRKTRFTLLRKRQQCRSNVRCCRKNRSTCRIRHCRFDIVASTVLLRHRCWCGRGLRVVKKLEFNIVEICDKKLMAWSMSSITFFLVFTRL